MARVTYNRPHRPTPPCLCGRREPSEYFLNGIIAGFMLGMAFAYLGFWLFGIGGAS